MHCSVTNSCQLVLVLAGMVLPTNKVLLRIVEVQRSQLGASLQTLQTKQWLPYEGFLCCCSTLSSCPPPLPTADATPDTKNPCISSQPISRCRHRSPGNFCPSPFPTGNPHCLHTRFSTVWPFGPAPVGPNKSGLLLCVGWRPMTKSLYSHPFIHLGPSPTHLVRAATAPSSMWYTKRGTL